MRHGNSQRRGRKRNNNNGNRRSGNNRSQVFDSNGPDVRIRGTAYQVSEKYEALAKDAAASGDITMEQNYLQHAEHYLRIISSFEQDGSDDRQRSTRSREKSENDEDGDLSLPSSILGDEVNVKSEGARAEMA